MKIAMIVLAGALMPLTACGGLSDSHSSMPETSRQPSAAPSQPDGEPDVKELVRAAADGLFTTSPSALSVSQPRRLTAGRFSACVEALVPSLVDGAPRPATLVVMIEHGKLIDRRRATTYDKCANETYEKVEVRP